MGRGIAAAVAQAGLDVLLCERPDLGRICSGEDCRRVRSRDQPLGLDRR